MAQVIRSLRALLLFWTIFASYGLQWLLWKVLGDRLMGERWQRVHGKSTPLMLPADDRDLIDKWLDPGFDRVEEFKPLLQPRFPETVNCVPVQRPGDQRVLGESFKIEADDEQ